MEMQRLESIRHVALDMDGTLYRGSTLFDATPGFLARLRELDIGYSFLTNNCSKSVQDYLLHLGRLGIDASADQIYTSGLCTIDYLRREIPRCAAVVRTRDGQPLSGDAQRGLLHHRSR